MATQGVFHRRCTGRARRASYGRGPSRTGERVTWMRVVSSVAMVERTTASTMSLPPAPGQISSPSTARTFARGPRSRSLVRSTFTATVKALEQGEDDADPDQRREPGGTAAVAGLLAEVAGDVPAPVVERGDQGARRRTRPPSKWLNPSQAQSKAVRRRSHRCGTGRARREHREDHQLDAGHEELGPCGETGAAQHHDQHEQKPGRRRWPWPEAVLSASAGVEQAEGHLPGGQRAGHHEDGRRRRRVPSR